MTDYQITSWREIPSLVVARSGETVVKVSLPLRFQEAIDEAAMRLGDIDADAYISGWIRGPWQQADGAPGEVAEAISKSIINDFSDLKLSQILSSLPTAGTI